MRHESDRYRPIEGLELEMRDRLATKDAEITRLKADVTNRDEAIERMRRERSARVMGAHMDRVEGALGFPPDKPIIIDMVIARIEQLNAALARVRGQRDALAIGAVAMGRDKLVGEQMILTKYGLRIVGGTVEEIES